MNEANRNTVWAGAFADELARLGVRHVCVASGSRCAPLVFAFAGDERFRLYPHLDERSAAFLALGIGRAAGTPAAVVTTSGTAAANLLPAVVEASLGESPLLVLTADRPARLRGLDANQTIDQTKLFGGYPRAFFDVPTPSMDERGLRYLRALASRALAAATGPGAGPVHLNFQFEKPLEPTPVVGDVPPDVATGAGVAARGRADATPFTRPGGAAEAPAVAVVDALAERIRGAPRGLLVCGPSATPERAGAASLRLAAATGYPLLADPLSGARFAPGAPEWAVGPYDAVLAEPSLCESLRPELVIRLGATPTSASAAGFLERWQDVPQVVVAAGNRWKDHTATAATYIQAEPAAVCRALADRIDPVGAPDWAAGWRRVAAEAARTLERELAAGFFEGAALARAVGSLPAHATLFIGNSLAIRDVDAFAMPSEVPIRVVGLRGASGIDGNVSAALGASLVSEGPTLAALGDLALCHDMNGLLAARSLQPDIVFLVVNNDGGGIFHTLPIRDFEDVLLPYVVMPHGLDFARVAGLYGLAHRRVREAAETAAAVSECLAEGGPQLVEVVSDREANCRRREQVLGAMRAAARAAS